MHGIRPRLGDGNDVILRVVEVPGQVQPTEPPAAPGPGAGGASGQLAASGFDSAWTLWGALGAASVVAVGMLLLARSRRA